jgi:hypothetical protein
MTIIKALLNRFPLWEKRDATINARRKQMFPSLVRAPAAAR